MKNDEIAGLYQENLEHSKLLSILAETLSFRLSDYCSLYKKTKDDAISCISKCSFLQLSNDKETGTYNDQFIVYITNELNEDTINLLKKDFSFERLYQRKDKKTVLYLSNQNDNSKLEEQLNGLSIKADKYTKSSIISSIVYSKEALNLKPKHKNSDTGSVSGSCSGTITGTGTGNSTSQPWRKFSGYSKNSFDSYKGSGYNKKYKRERFNSDGGSKWSNNYYNFNTRPQGEEIEIDISKIKYSLHVKYKYPLESIQKLYQEMKNKNQLDTKPLFIKNEEIVSDTLKTIVAFNSIESGKGVDESKKSSGNAYENQSQAQSNDGFNIKIPQTNPLSSMPRNFNKFDMVPQNKGAGLGLNK